MDFGSYFTRLAHYHAWATQGLLDAAAQVSDADWTRDMGLFFGSIHRTVNHLVVTDHIWWARFAEGESLRIPLDAVPHAWREEACGALAVAVARWQPWAAALAPDRFDGDLVYTRNNGDAIRVPFAPALGHVFNHATHHRGQVTAALTALGRPGPALDWIYLQQQQARSTP